jgi:hypothetical protein
MLEKCGAKMLTQAGADVDAPATTDIQTLAAADLEALVKDEMSAVGGDGLQPVMGAEDLVLDIDANEEDVGGGPTAAELAELESFEEDALVSLDDW